MPQIVETYNAAYDAGECVVFEHHGRMNIGVIERKGYVDHDAGHSIWYPVRTNVTYLCDYNSCGGDVSEYDILGHPTFQYPTVTPDIAKMITSARNLGEAFSRMTRSILFDSIKPKVPSYRGDRVVFVNNNWLYVGTYVGIAVPTREELKAEEPPRFILQVGCGDDGPTYVRLPMTAPWLIMEDSGSVAERFGKMDSHDTMPIVGGKIDE